MYDILGRYDISQWFFERMHTLHDEANASVQINETMTGQIPFQCAVRQGYPLSMVL